MAADRKVELEVRYELGHCYRETWVPTDFHCPKCSARRVWADEGPGDYYEGPMHLCVKCGTTFALPRMDDEANWQNRQRRAAIMAVEEEAV